MSPRRHLPRALLLLALAASAPTTARAQDTLHLVTLQEAAVARDPRAAQPALLRAASELRLGSLDAERRPQLSLNALASHQSDVTALTLQLPGAAVPTPPKDRWQATADVTQLLYDGGTLEARRALERSRLAESSAAVDAALFRLRADVNAAFFSAFLLQERARELDALLADLDARLAVVRARVREGTALGRDSAALVAERLRAELSRDEALSARGASLAVLARLAGREVRATDVLALPDLAPAIAAARTQGDVGSLRVRPEFAQFRRTRARIDREVALTAMERRPRVVAFGQGGAGRPGLDQFRTGPDEFWQAGVRVEWRPWTWGNTGRSAEALRMQQRIVETEERALADALARAVEGDLAEMARLERALATDTRVIALREEIERQARAQFTEGVVTAADYVESRTDVLEARLTLQRHRAELAQAQARFLTTLGLPPR